MKAKVLESNRLRLSPLNTSFCQQYYVDWLNDFEVNEFLVSGGNYTIRELAEYLIGVEQKDMLFWAIIIKSTGKHVGNIKIEIDELDDSIGEYGIMIGDKNEWGKGYAKEASILVIEECFKIVNVINLGFVESNARADFLYTSIGFSKVAKPIKHQLSNGHYENHIRMSLKKEHWLNDR